MWLAKLLGGRDIEGADEEPTAVPPPPAAAAPVIARPPSRPAAKARVIDPKRKGFDPYNSGAFERRNAWERIGRR